jgi:hypothetical protein
MYFDVPRPSKEMFAESITLTAEHEAVHVKSLASPQSTNELSAKVKFLKFDGSESSPAAAYVGFYQDLQKESSVQLALVHDRQSPHLVARYTLIEQGRETQSEQLAIVPADGTIRLFLRFNEGTVMVGMDGIQRTIQTTFTHVAPYLSVASGTAEFAVQPNRAFENGRADKRRAAQRER